LLGQVREVLLYVSLLLHALLNECSRALVR
jgi:hypothetical protein